ncbi:MAG: FKBP-type peptidyl-prolyl cis-trans isomerase [Myxococcota bacterium]|nr:FKBP-type peptidyl-prolyl cis-trans isomerase [Myxococcota bacterium]
MKRIGPILVLFALACGDSDVVGGGGSNAGPGGSSSGSGITVTHIEEGSGPSPTATDVVLVHYHGTFPDGRVFDSSVDRGQPAQFPLNRVIPCWTQGVQQMNVGGKAQLVCPPESAYGAQGAGPIPPNSTLHFDVELLGIQ